MIRRMLAIFRVFLCMSGTLLPWSISVSTKTKAANSSTEKTTLNFPTVDPNYIYNQLFYLSLHFQHREAGFDKNLPSNKEVKLPRVEIPSMPIEKHSTLPAPDSSGEAISNKCINSLFFWEDCLAIALIFILLTGGIFLFWQLFKKV